MGRFIVLLILATLIIGTRKDSRDINSIQLKENQKLIIDIEKLASFVSEFSEQKRFYYGWNPRAKKNWHIVIKAEKCGFIKNTKPMQFIKHYIGEGVVSREGRTTRKDVNGTYIEIPKSNFDVEISVDAIRLLQKYDSFCLFSGDSDFTYLVNFLKKNKKKFIVIASRPGFSYLKRIGRLVY